MSNLTALKFFLYKFDKNGNTLLPMLFKESKKSTVERLTFMSRMWGQA